MCGASISQGILCEKCDKPRKPKAEAAPKSPEPAAPPAPRPTPKPPAAPVSAPVTVTQRTGETAAVALDAFPKAPVLPFPVESASPALTSVVSLLIAAAVPAVLLGADRSVKFVSDDATKLFNAAQAEMKSLKFIEQQIGIRVGELSVPATSGIHIGGRNVLYSLVPLSGGASGAVLVFRPAAESHASFATYVRETVFGPLRGLHDSLVAASRTRANDPFLADLAGTVEQILSALELAPEVEEQSTARRDPTVTDVVRRVADRFVPFADLKNVQLQVDAQDLEERFSDHEQLADALSILMDNAMHYVPAGGQVVIGVRWMEHKGAPLLLFFVMDNGPVVPEALRQSIFEPDYVWQPSSPERTGRSLFRAREFAVAHAGSVWVESKTGKACTFFLRVRPDSAR
jgi:signal transduction histidine kinase